MYHTNRSGRRSRKWEPMKKCRFRSWRTNFATSSVHLAPLKATRGDLLIVAANGSASPATGFRP